MPFRQKAVMEQSKSFSEKWPEHRERLRKDYPHLKDEDLEYEPGREEDLVLRLHEKLQKTKSEIRNWLHLMG